MGLPRNEGRMTKKFEGSGHWMGAGRDNQIETTKGGE